jgi:hypothetical protein
MPSPGALYAAVDLAESPILVAVMRQRPLPPDVLRLIQIAAGAARPLRQSADAVGKDPAFVRSAAIFYIEQVLWANDADNYRVLGVNPDTSPVRVAEHLRWFMKWLHPDVGSAEMKPALIARVLKAWEALKTRDRRRQYDRLLTQRRRYPPAQRLARPAAQLSARRIPWIASSARNGRKVSIALNWDFALLAGAAVMALIISIAWTLGGFGPVIGSATLETSNAPLPATAPATPSSE